MTYKILVIDDKDFIRQKIVELLTNEQFEVIQAINGKQGVQLAIREQPHLIICDIVMPDLGGDQVLEKLRQISETSSIPFIFLTARSNYSSRWQAGKLGMDDYLVKPFTKEELIGAVRSRLQKQTFFLAQLNSCYEEVKHLKHKNQQVENRKQVEEEIISNFIEDLRGNFSKLNLAVQLLKKEASAEKRARYIAILEQELASEIQLLNKVSHLQTLMKSEDFSFLEQYKLLENSKQNHDDKTSRSATTQQEY